MKWIESRDLEGWADKRVCQDSLPHLVRKLIRTTTKSIKKIKFPAGENVQLSGWDGILEAEESTEYIPKGVSVWEFGAGVKTKKKAEDEYVDRTKNPLGFDPSKSTFVFVTPRCWANGEKWAKLKRAEGIWKDVRVYNAETLDEWIECSPTTGAWLAKKHLNKYPGEGILPSDLHWEEWSSGKSCTLAPQVLLGGRDKERDILYDSLDKPEVTNVKGLSSEEALAFILACFKVAPDKEEDFFARSIVVKTPDAFRELTVHDRPLILIPMFEDSGIFYNAIQRGHKVLAVLGNESSEENSINLPPIDREEFCKALMLSGLSEDMADKYTSESTRNITILRRHLNFTNVAPEWARRENVRDIIPALLVGRWNAAHDHDREIVARVAGESYDAYIIKLTKWLYVADSPIIKIGDSWRIASVFDAWTHSSRYLTQNDFQVLKESVLTILKEQSPAFELEPRHRYAANIYGKSKKYSYWINEGVIHSLIMTSLFGDKLQFDVPVSADVWVNRVVRELLDDNDPIFWKTIHYHLPLIAEASPSGFLSAIEKKLEEPNSPIVSLFEEDPGFIINRCYYTGILHALEGLAWLPEYFTKSCLMLAKLAAIDPGGSISNRPSNSLLSIIRPQYYQTLASYDHRISVLKLICQQEPVIAWKLLKDLLPDHIGTYASRNHVMRWRMFKEETQKTILISEVRKTFTAIVDLMLTQFSHSEQELSVLLDESTNVAPTDREKILDFVEQAILKVEHNENLVWNEARKILSWHRSVPDASFAFPETELVRYQKLYDSLYPTDPDQQVIWLFEDSWPALQEGIDRVALTHQERQKILDTKREDGLRSIYDNFGINKIIELGSRVKEKHILGNIFARIIDNQNETLIVCDQLLRKSDNLKFVESFIFYKSYLNPTWGVATYDELVARGFTDENLSDFFIAHQTTGDLWRFIDSKSEELRNRYWTGMSMNFYTLTVEDRIQGLKYLVEYKRFATAINACAYIHDDIPTDLLIEILDGPTDGVSSEELPVRSHGIGEIFEAIDERGDADPQKLMFLEWRFIDHLTSGVVRRKSRLLHQQLTERPEFFMMMVSFIYKDDQDDKEQIPDELIYARAWNARELLKSWKAIPGMDNDGNIDAKILNDWISEVRKIAKDKNLEEITDVKIGNLFVYYPEKTEPWPCDEICDVIERINTPALFEGFSIENFNKRGFTSRGVYDGGTIENHRAEYFQRLANLHQIKFPMVSEMFQKISKGYRADAKEMDQRALKTSLEH